jgi:hypothetical protein
MAKTWYCGLASDGFWANKDTVRLSRINAGNFSFFAIMGSPLKQPTLSGMA